MDVLARFRPGDSLQCANEERPSSLGGIGLVGKAPGADWLGGSDATKRDYYSLFLALCSLCRYFVIHSYSSSFFIIMYLGYFYVV